MTQEPDVGAIVNRLGVKAPHMTDDRLVSAIVVIMRYVETEGNGTGLYVTRSEGADMIDEIGMLTAAKHISLAELDRNE